MVSADSYQEIRLSFHFCHLARFSPGLKVGSRFCTTMIPSFCSQRSLLSRGYLLVEVNNARVVTLVISLAQARFLFASRSSNDNTLMPGKSVLFVDNTDQCWHDLLASKNVCLCFW